MNKKPNNQAIDASPEKREPFRERGGGRMRDPMLPPEKRATAGMKVGDPCGVVRGNFVPCADLLYGDPDDGTARCPRHCRQPTRNPDSLSELCPQWRMRGRKRCKRHGGATRTGTLHPGYRAGHQSRWAPFVGKERQRIARLVATGDPLDLYDDLLLMRTRAAEVLQAAEQCGMPDASLALPLLEKVAQAVSGADDDAALRYLGDLRGVLVASRAIERAWDKLDDVMATTTKMVESQRKRAVEGKKYMTVEDAMEMINQMGAALKAKAEEILPKEKSDELLTAVGREWAAQQGIDSAPEVEGVM